MKIEIISVSALSEGAEMLLTVGISDGVGRVEKRKILLFTEQYLEMGLCKGMHIPEDTLDTLEQMSKKCKAMKKGSELLSYSASSQTRLVQRLCSKGIDRESAREAAEQLERLGAINERGDVERLVRSCLKKLWGKKRIYSDLCAKGYDRDIISAELENVDEDIFIENCRELFIKKFKKMPQDPVDQKKIIASLTRYGYSFSEIKKAIQKQ